jgi:diaminopimelate epimerase
MVGDDWPDPWTSELDEHRSMIPHGRSFYKMSGSGNDFIMVDARHEPAAALAEPTTVQALCARGTGVGADGIVFLEPSSVATIRLVYLNADGSRADFCGNATLCTTRLAAELGLGKQGNLTIETDAGVVSARLEAGLPEIDLQPVSTVRLSSESIEPGLGERRIGFALAGVPHLTILCDDVSTVDVVGRGRPLRHHTSLNQGANVNFVSRAPGGWRMRTYERGVEGETLACGSGAVATAILLTAWGEASSPVEVETRSGKPLRVRLRRDGSVWNPSLAGEGRVVYQGMLAET